MAYDFELLRLLELAGVTIASATERSGEINRKKANQMVDPKGYFQKDKDKNFHGKGSFNEVVEPTLEAFGRREGTAVGDIPHPTTQEIANCRKAKNANQYADQNNPYYPVDNTDPDWMHQKAEDEDVRLKNRWVQLHNAGYF